MTFAVCGVKKAGYSAHAWVEGCSRSDNELWEDHILRSHKIRLNPTSEQVDYFLRCAEVARKTWNWALGEYNLAYERGEKPKVLGLKKEFNRLRSENKDFYAEVSQVQTYANQYAFTDLQFALSRFFKLNKEGKLKPSPGKKPRKDGKPTGFPRFKSKRDTIPAFGVANVAFDTNEHTLTISKCPGVVNMAEHLRFEGKILGARITRHAGYWYLSVQMEVPDTQRERYEDNNVGVDLGIKSLAVTSDGVIYENPKAFRKIEKKLAKMQRSFARKTEGGKNWQKQKEKIVKLHNKAANVRKENLHKITTELTDNYSLIAIENLNIEGMKKNRRLAKAVSDSGMSEFRRQLEYKSEASGSKVVVIDRWYPSSRLCNNCGSKNDDLTLSQRIWECKECGSVNDRDLNAALNIRDEGVAIYHK